jgi:hypothetical protein
MEDWEAFMVFILIAGLLISLGFIIGQGTMPKPNPRMIAMYFNMSDCKVTDGFLLYYCKTKPSSNYQCFFYDRSSDILAESSKCS